MLVVFEGLILSFWLLLICVVGIAKDGPVGLVIFYEQEVQDRAIEIFMPYIYGKTLAVKWLGTLVGFPILAAIISAIITLVM